jgi:hypothetical protein
MRARAGMPVSRPRFGFRRTTDVTAGSPTLTSGRSSNGRPAGLSPLEGSPRLMHS